MSKKDLRTQAHEAMLEMRFEDAIRIHDYLLKQDPSNVEVIYFKGQALSNLQKDPEAIAVFDQALRLLNPDSTLAAEVLVSKGNSLLWLERVNEAEQCYDRALRISPGIGRIWVEKARAAVHKKDFRKSVEYCDRAIAIDACDARAWNNKAFALLQMGKLDECVRCGEKAIALKPEYTTAWLWLAQAHERNGDQRRAAECYENVQRFGQAGMLEETKGLKPVRAPKAGKKWWKPWG